MAAQKEELQSEESLWSSIPIDILHEILSRLSWSNHPNFSLVCKHWRSAVSPFYPAWITPALLNTVNVDSDRICYYSPYFNKNFEVERKLETPYGKICCVTGGILTVCRNGELIVANLVTGARRKLPLSHARSFDFSVYDNGEMFGISLPWKTVHGVVRGMTMQCLERIWFDSGPQTDFPTFEPSPICNPVFHGDLLYCLGENGQLAVYNPNEWQKAWRVLPKPESFGNFTCEYCYLLDSEEELMAILIGCRGAPVHVLKLNEEVMEWEKVDALDGHAIFTGTLTTVWKKTTLRNMENRVFLPRFYGTPETIKVDLINSNGEVAFVPKSLSTEEAKKCSEGSIWCHELCQDKNQEFWDTESLDYSIWIDFSTDDHTYDFPDYDLDEFTTIYPDDVEDAE